MIPQAFISISKLFRLYKVKSRIYLFVIYGSLKLLIHLNRPTRTSYLKNIFFQGTKITYSPLINTFKVADSW